MLSREDSVWLAREYPDLTLAPHEVKGLLKFTGAYHEGSGRFFILNYEPADAEIGTVLSGAFEIKICGRLGLEATILPKLFVVGVPHTLDHHFYQNDFSACLCSPLQHQDFLIPKFEFRRFFNELVVPFLYGQVFLSVYGKWPWGEFAHGATGILEAYAVSNGKRKTQICVGFLSQDHNWPRIKSILLEESLVDANLQCFCRSGQIIGHCHPQALQGARQLQKDLWYWPVSLL
jgi:hypothetical protein